MPEHGNWYSLIKTASWLTHIYIVHSSCSVINWKKTMYSNLFYDGHIARLFLIVMTNVIILYWIIIEILYVWPEIAVFCTWWQVHQPVLNCDKYLNYKFIYFHGLQIIESWWTIQQGWEYFFHHFSQFVHHYKFWINRYLVYLTLYCCLQHIYVELVENRDMYSLYWLRIEICIVHTGWE